MRNILTIIVACIIISGCNNKMPADILPPAKMRDVLWEVIQVDAYTDNFIKKDSSKNVAVENATLRKQVFSIHKTTKEVFDKSYLYYTDKPELMSALLDSIETKKNISRRDIFEHKQRTEFKKKLQNE